MTCYRNVGIDMEQWWTRELVAAEEFTVAWKGIIVTRRLCWSHMILNTPASSCPRIGYRNCRILRYGPKSFFCDTIFSLCSICIYFSLLIHLAYNWATNPCLWIFHLSKLYDKTRERRWRMEQFSCRALLQKRLWLECFVHIHLR